MTNCVLSLSIIFKMHTPKISLILNDLLSGEGRRRKGNQNAKEIMVTLYPMRLSFLTLLE